MKSKTCNEFKFLVLSDIHLGNRRNTSEEIISNLNIYLKDDFEFSQLDMIVLAGDIFDTFLTSMQIIPIVNWIARLLRLCKKHDVALRVLKGTPSHDWDQNILFEKINNEVSNIGADLQYIKDLSIVYDERFDMNFLYVPDECHPKAEDTFIAIEKMMIDIGLKEVDYAFMHGNFEYQLPEFVKVPKHDSASFLKIVKHLIFIGHIHKYSNFDRIYAQGSFDRLSHGEEQAKGFLKVIRNKDNSHDVQFIENVHAKKFITIDCTNLTVEEGMKKINEISLQLPERSYISILANENSPLFANFNEIIKLNSNVFIAKNPVKANNDILTDTDVEIIFEPIEIRSDNIKQLLQERLVSLNLSSELYSKSLFHIDEMLKGV